MTYLHTGIPVFDKMDDMMFIEPLKVWITDTEKSPYKIEWLYFEPDSPMAAAIQSETHVAYAVEDIEKAVEGKNVLWPVTAFPNMKIAFVYDDGLPVEFVQML